MKLALKYPRSDIFILHVPAIYSSWDVEYPEYDPPYYTSQRVLNHPSWADVETAVDIKFNQIDGDINRTSYTGVYPVINMIPRNPKERTGIKGRGLLGKWGPNHAVDIIISRWGENNHIECISIRRKDNGRLAFPGGMVDNGEMLEQAMIRESVEEVLNLSDSEEVEKGMKWLQRNIPKGIDIYKGYVCDERNTDNAWIETCVRACLETQEDKIDFPFKAGTDADDAFWTKVSHNSTHMHHKDILQSFCDRIGAKF